MTAADTHFEDAYRSPPPRYDGWSLPRVDPNAPGVSLIERLDRAVLVVLWVTFVWGISRVGMALVPEFTNPAWLAGYAVTTFAIVRRPNVYLDLIRRNLVFVLASLFCILSSLWSFMPSLSTYSGVLLLLNTLVGFAIAERIGIVRAITVLFFYMFLAMGLSIFFMKVLPAYWAFDEAGNAKGLYMHKNSLALNANVLYFTSLILFAAGWRRWLTVVGVVIALVGLKLSNSGTGYLLCAFSTAVLISCALAAPGRRSSLFFSGLFFCTAAIGTAVLLMNGVDLASGTLNLLGKDATLTGRTFLWDQALKTWADYPWLGVGYNAFWYSPELPAEAIWMAIGQRLMSFHNIYLDRLADVGAVGFLLFAGILVILLYRTARLFLIHRTPLSAWPFAFVALISIDSLTEFPIFWNGEWQLVLAVIAAGTCGAELRTGIDALRDRPSPSR